MSKIEKAALSQYLRTRCDRFLYLSLFRKSASEHTLLPLSGRPGIAAFKARGREFESQKMGELQNLFGPRCMHVQQAAKRSRSRSPEDVFALQLDALPEPPQYWLEPALKKESFAHTLLRRQGLAPESYPDLSDLRPDVVELLDPAATGHHPVYILDAAGAIAEWTPSDGRQCLRVIDMKATEHINTSYAAEVVLYSMVLAAWLEQRELDRKFVVSALPAIWVQGLYKSLRLPKETAPLAERTAWVDEQLETADAQLYLPPMLKFLREDVPRVLAASDWRQDLDWGVAPTCGQCDWLGLPAWSKRALRDAQDIAAKAGWQRAPSLDDYCYAEAEQGQLAMQIPQLTTGMRRTLTQADLTTLPQLADRPPGDPAFQGHNGLRILAPRLPYKSHAILSGETLIRPDFQTAQMARFANLRLTINVSFDAATGMLISLGLGIDFREPTKWNAARDDESRDALTRKQVVSYFVDKPDPELELEQLLDFLRTISYTLSWIRSPESYREGDEQTRRDRAKNAWDHTTVQVCFWDERQAQALRDAIGRHLYHLSGHDVLPGAFWFFPPEELVGSDRTADTPPICYLKQVATGLAILPTTINDDLISVTEALVDFEAKLSDFQWDRIGGAIPKERALEIWQQMPPKNPPMSLSQCRRQYERIMDTLVHAMRQLVFYLVSHHKEKLRSKAPLVRLLQPSQFRGVAPDALLWLAHLGFEEGAQRLEQRVTMTMEPHEMEARFMALRTTGMLQAEAAAAAHLAKQEISVQRGRYVFEVRPTSEHVKFRNETPFLTLLPEQPTGAGLMTVKAYTEAIGAAQPDFTLPYWQRLGYMPMWRFMGAQLVHFDRDQSLAVVDLFTLESYERARQDLFDTGALDFSQPLVLLEREGIPTFDQIKDVATHIGNPLNAMPAPETAEALVKLSRKPGSKPPKRVARLLWEPYALARAETGVDTSACDTVLDLLQSHTEVGLNDDQRAAIRHTLSHALSLVWGGPGTGKTRTLVLAILADIVLRKRSHLTPVRVLVSTLTYRALTEIIERVAETLTGLPHALREQLGLADGIRVTFVASRERARVFAPFLEGDTFCGLPAQFLARGDAAEMRDALLGRASGQTELVFGVSRQTYTLGKGGGKAKDKAPPSVADLFDRIWIDESSQLAVSQALPVLALLGEHGAIALFGDRLQMPPVQMAPPPRHAAYLVGSIHTYLYERIHRFELQQRGEATYAEQFLRVNYRSCEPIVAFSRQIGYRDEFEAAFADQRLAHVPLASEMATWDTDVVAPGPIYEAILDPERPCVAVTYDDGRHGQANTFEAVLVAGTILTHRASRIQQATAQNRPFDEHRFWTETIGVVTPHRAQRAAVVTLLQRALRSEAVPAHLIDDAVDTVERFQGGERTLILVSFGLGDPDLIQREESFLFQKERINVAVTRAKAKVILFVTRDLSFHLPDDPVVIEASKAIKNFVYQHALHEDPTVGVTAAGRQVDVRVRYRTYSD